MKRIERLLRVLTPALLLSLSPISQAQEQAAEQLQPPPEVEAEVSPAEVDNQLAQSPANTGYLTQDQRAYEREHKFEKALQYYLEFNPGKTAEDFEQLRPWLRPFTDVEIMMDMFADPRKMVQWMDAISEPEAVYLMMKCSTEPVMWDTWLHGLTDMEKMTRAMFRFMDPTMYMNWMVAMMDPNFYTSMLAFLDPNKYLRWSTVSMNPKFYEPMFAFMDPNWYTPRMQWMFDPQTFQPVLNMFAIPQPQS